jgi:hypothetical protein
MLKIAIREAGPRAGGGGGAGFRAAPLPVATPRAIYDRFSGKQW